LWPLCTSGTSRPLRACGTRCGLPASSDRKHHDDDKKAQKSLHRRAPLNELITCTRQFIAVNDPPAT
jgi:hypothetical protein